jgi:hypothetical protein
MANLTERTLGFGFGLLGGGLIVLAAIVSLVVGAVDLVTGRTFGALSAGTEAVVLFVVGALALLFAYLAHRSWKDRPIVSGVLLVVIAAVGWGVLGFGGSVIALIGAIFVFLAGVLYLLVPVKSSIASAASA